jgi:hypothetical protein
MCIDPRSPAEYAGRLTASNESWMHVEYFVQSCSGLKKTSHMLRGLPARSLVDIMDDISPDMNAYGPNSGTRPQPIEGSF